MNKLFNQYFDVIIQRFFYRFRYLILYLIFGFLSLIIEFITRDYFINSGYSYKIATSIAIMIGIGFAFFSNLKFNFEIPKSRQFRSLFYFISISLLSITFQWFIINFLSFENYRYEHSRLYISGILFLFGYLLHRKFSFRDSKKVGVAIYANGVEDINSIYKKISYYPDFIHVDVVDNTMSKNAEEIKSYRLETIQAYWPNAQIQTHIMSLNPSKWLNDLLEYSDVVYVHVEAEEDIESLLLQIKSVGKKAGLAITMNTEINQITHYLNQADYILILTIPDPGSSGQKFDKRGLDRIKELNELQFRNNFILCVDGGVNEKNVKQISAENIVSGSSVLKNQDPKKQIMRLQTGSRYESL